MTDASGRARVFRPAGEMQPLRLPEQVIEVSPNARFRLAEISLSPGGAAATLAFNHESKVHFVYHAPDGTAIGPSALDSVHLKSSVGERVVVEPSDDVWLQATRSVTGGRAVKPVSWSVERVDVGGTNVVYADQQRFLADRRPTVGVTVLFFSVRFRARDALFSFPAARGVLLQYPNGRTVRHELGPGRELTIGQLPRGTYKVTAVGGGLQLTRPVVLTRDQDVDLKLFSWLDVGAVLAALVMFASGLVMLGRRRARRGHEPPGSSGGDGAQVARSATGREVPIATPVVGFVARAGEDSRRRRTGVLRRRRRAAVLATLLIVLVLVGVAEAPAARAATTTPRAPLSPEQPPVLAHYYIWFNASSWNRAKRDYPSLGRYSSDEASVMRRHVDMAKAAGIDGFIVSWKSSDVLDQRLRKLVDIASERRFHLAIAYQGLDFQRDPLPADRVGRDLDVFLADFAGNPVFGLFGKPLVIWMGTWAFSADEVRGVTTPRRDRLQILASEKQVDGYERLADAVDGEHYYWTGADPVLNGRYASKLASIAATVRAHGGRWIAPAAPGFDARMVGGRKVIPRRGGETLRAAWQAAIASLPDAIGVISWNEFSENTHIEASKHLGAAYLQVVRDLTGAPAPSGELDSGSSGRAAYDGGRLLTVLGAAGAVVVGPLYVRRRRRRTSATGQAQITTDGPRVRTDRRRGRGRETEGGSDGAD